MVGHSHVGIVKNGKAKRTGCCLSGKEGKAVIRTNTRRVRSKVPEGTRSSRVAGMLEKRSVAGCQAKTKRGRRGRFKEEKSR